MSENNKPSKQLSDHALERVMRDVLGGIWEISPECSTQEGRDEVSSFPNTGNELESNR
jgi:hypothetical protein